MTRAILAVPDVGHDGGVGRSGWHLAEALVGLGVETHLVSLRASPKPLGTTIALASEESPRAQQVKGRAKARFALMIARATAGSDILITTHLHLAPVGALVSATRGIPHIVWLHGTEAWRKPSVLMRQSVAHASTIWCASHYTRDRALTWVDSGQSVVVLPHAVPDAFLARDPVPPSARKATVLSVARLEHGYEYKGVDTLLRSWGRVLQVVPSARLRIVGHGTKRDDYIAMAAELGLDGSVTFLGRVSDDQLADEYRDARLFALPGRADSQRGEGFGLVFIEAAAAAVPSVAGASGGVRDAVEHGRTGLVVDGGSPETVASGIIRVLTDDGLADRLGFNGHEMVRRRHSSTVVRNQISQHLSKLLPASHL